jgi:hypothetical protein
MSPPSWADLEGPHFVYRLLHEEHERSKSLDRAFSVLRIESRTELEQRRDLFALYRIVAATLRTSDRIHPVSSRELCAILPDAEGARADVVMLRVRLALEATEARFRVRLGCASVRPKNGDTWQAAWCTAGTLLLADGALPAAA